PDIDPIGEVRVFLQQGAEAFHRGIAGVINKQYRMRIAHGNGTDRGWPAIGINGVTGRFCFGAERNAGRFQYGDAHVDAHQVVAGDVQFDDPASRFDTDVAFVREFFVAHKFGKTACAIAALFHFATISVVNAVAEIDIRVLWRLDQQDLVTANAE